ncbi:MAG: ATPase, T2SS/T4P/T4SS family [Candidatus Paceibacterota bacterium]|jgi:type IV pilus assembly protein PilB
MLDRQFIEELVRRGIVSQPIAERVLQEALLSGGSAEEILYEKKIVDEANILKIKSEIYKAPYRKVDTKSVPEELFKLISRDMVLTYRVIPIERTPNMLIVGMFRPDNQKAQDALKFIAKQQGISLGIYLVSLSDVAALLARYSPYKKEIEAAILEIGEIKTEKNAIDLEESGKGEDAPIIKIVASTLRQAVEIGASDIHIEPQRRNLRIRFRLDGALHEAVMLPSTLIQPITSRVKVLSRLKLDETRVPQDGRFRTNFLGREIDYRVATFPTPSGEKIAIRVLDPKTGLRGLDQLGLGSYNVKQFEEGLARPYGMILISGPTGSGKSTTLYSVLSRLNKESVNIVTLEDPVEYFMEGVNQSQVRPEIGYTFASGLRQILRQDPDVIMVGEIRDSETAGLAVNAALTGHVMLSTIHTNNSLGVIPRLVDLGVQPFLLSSSLNLMVAQRLVLRVCPDCRISERADKKTEKLIDDSFDLLLSEVRSEIPFSKPYTIYKKGNNLECKTCKGKGTVGRVALYEMFRMTRELGDLISKGFTESALSDEARRQGMVTLRQDGFVKVLEGKIGLEEVLKETA